MAFQLDSNMDIFEESTHDCLYGQKQNSKALLASLFFSSDSCLAEHVTSSETTTVNSPFRRQDMVVPLFLCEETQTSSCGFLSQSQGGRCDVEEKDDDTTSLTLSSQFSMMEERDDEDSKADGAEEKDDDAEEEEDMTICTEPSTQGEDMDGAQPETEQLMSPQQEEQQPRNSDQECKKEQPIFEHEEEKKENPARQEGDDDNEEEAAEVAELESAEPQNHDEADGVAEEDEDEEEWMPVPKRSNKGCVVSAKRASLRKKSKPDVIEQRLTASQKLRRNSKVMDDWLRQIRSRQGVELPPVQLNATVASFSRNTEGHPIVRWDRKWTVTMSETGAVTHAKEGGSFTLYIPRGADEVWWIPIEKKRVRVGRPKRDTSGKRSSHVVIGCPPLPPLHSPSVDCVTEGDGLFRLYLGWKEFCIPFTVGQRGPRIQAAPAKKKPRN